MKRRPKGSENQKHEKIILKHGQGVASLVADSKTNKYIEDWNHLINPSIINHSTAVNRVPRCDVTKILILEYLNFGSGF